MSTNVEINNESIDNNNSKSNDINLKDNSNTKTYTNFKDDEINTKEEVKENGNINNNTSSNTETTTNSDSFKVKNLSFYPTKNFPHLKVLNANYVQIKEELLSLIEKDKSLKKEDKFFQPWIEHDLYEESNPNGWDVGPLMIGGTYIENNCVKAKYLYSVIKEIPGLKSVSFSLLKPNTHIVAHQGYDEYSEKVLRYHMGMIVPKGDLGIRVATEVKVWKEGESFIFDDFLIHEAWNFSNEDRYVLICDFTDINIEDKFEIKDDNFNKSVSNYLK